jgi:hypothetical protein
MALFPLGYKGSPHEVSIALGEARGRWRKRKLFGVLKTYLCVHTRGSLKEVGISLREARGRRWNRRLCGVSDVGEGKYGGLLGVPPR